MQFRPLYTAAGANKASSSSDIRPDGLLAFAAGAVVCLWQSTDPLHRGIQETLLGHQAPIFALKYCKTNPKYLLTGDADGVFKLWNQNNNWECVLTCQAHQGSLSCLDLLQDASNPDRLLLFTAGSDSVLHVWNFAPQDALDPSFKPVQSLSLNGKLPLSISACALPDPLDLLIALTYTDIKIMLYSGRIGSEIRFASHLEGHTNWIRALDFSPIIDNNYILLASGSQDNYVRLWRIATGQIQAVSEDDPLELTVKSLSFVPNGSPNVYSVTSESVLLGHEGWVTDLRWNAPLGGLPQLATTSADRSLIIWELSELSSLWLNKARLGELGGTSGLGFFGALWGPDSRSVFAHDWAGSVHVWTEQAGFWQAGVGTSGHTKSVQAIDWQAQGKWLASCSLDQTTRIHSVWSREEAGKQIATWHEVARPQTHGHDIYALALLEPETGLRFASGADETIIRLFEAPGNFVERLTHLGCQGLPAPSDRPNAAIVPPLGLSNRSVPRDSKEESLYQSSAAPTSARPPVEEELLSSTLWPEYDKLYGHGFELRCLATSHSGKYLASSSRATSLEYASIHLRDTATNQVVGAPLTGHTLAVTRIRFSADDTFILAVGRDRSWHLWDRTEGQGYQPCISQAKAHTRVIWDCAWLSDTSFITVSRDKTCKVWQIDKQQANVTQTLTLGSAATAVDAVRYKDQSVAPWTKDGLLFTRRTIVAIGTEKGSVSLYKSTNNLFEHCSDVPSRLAHNATVNCLAFCIEAQQGRLLLASGGEDSLVRLNCIT